MNKYLILCIPSLPGWAAARKLQYVQWQVLMGCSEAHPYWTVESSLWGGGPCFSVWMWGGKSWREAGRSLPDAVHCDIWWRRDNGLGRTRWNACLCQDFLSLQTCCEDTFPVLQQRSAWFSWKFKVHLEAIMVHVYCRKSCISRFANIHKFGKSWGSLKQFHQTVRNCPSSAFSLHCHSWHQTLMKDFKSLFFFLNPCMFYLLHLHLRIVRYCSNKKEEKKRNNI